MAGYWLMVSEPDRVAVPVRSAFGSERPMTLDEARAALEQAEASPGAAHRRYELVEVSWLEAIEAGLRARFPGREDEKYRKAALRVHHELEVHGPVDDADRMFLGGPDEAASDVDVLIDRALLAVRERNARVVGPGSGLSHAELEAEVQRLREAMSLAVGLLSSTGAGDGPGVVSAAHDRLRDALAIDPTCSLCGAGHVPARACAPWAAEHVRESEELRGGGA